MDRYITLFLFHCSCSYWLSEEAFLIHTHLLTQRGLTLTPMTPGTWNSSDWSSLFQAQQTRHNISGMQHWSNHHSNTLPLFLPSNFPPSFLFCPFSFLSLSFPSPSLPPSLPPFLPQATGCRRWGEVCVWRTVQQQKVPTPAPEKPRSKSWYHHHHMMSPLHHVITSWQHTFVGWHQRCFWSLYPSTSHDLTWPYTV